MSADAAQLSPQDLPTALRLPDSLRSPVSADVMPPGSKSLTNRALLLAAMASGTSRVRRPLMDADDARQMRAALAQLGAVIEEGPEQSLVVKGVGGRWRPACDAATLDLGNAGTAARFLAGASLLSPVPLTIDGNARMRQRPIGELGTLLASLGCGVEYLGNPACPPVRITPPQGRVSSATVDVAPTQSSQFVSALLLVSPWIHGGITLRMQGAMTSASYVSMTLGLLARLGAHVQTSDGMRTIRVTGDDLGDGPGLRAFDCTIEPDASGATYFSAAAAMVPGSRIRVRGIDSRSLQGDAHFADLLARMGARVTENTEESWIETEGSRSLVPILADMADMPDAAMTLAAVACFAEGASVFHGLETLRVKECDRIEAMKTELAKIGVVVESPLAGEDGAMTLTPPPGGVDCSSQAPPVAFDTYDDHRMAMSLALIGLRRPNVTINHPACVAKTYPTFWSELFGLARGGGTGAQA